MKKLLSFAIAGSMALVAVPAFARTINVKDTVVRTSSRTLRAQHEKAKKLTASEACKDVWGTDRAKCARAFNKAGKPANWIWTTSSSSSSMSSAMSSSSMSTSSAASSTSSN